MARHVKKGDTVIVTAGNDNGRTGEVLRVYPDKDLVLVEGINVRNKHIKPTQQNQRGGIIQKEMPIHISNVSPVVDGEPTRVRFEVKDNGEKVRVAARTGKQLHALRGPKKKKKSTTAGKASETSA